VIAAIPDTGNTLSLQHQPVEIRAAPSSINASTGVLSVSNSAAVKYATYSDFRPDCAGD